MLLMNGADPKIKDNEGHVAKDFDFYPDDPGFALVRNNGAKQFSIYIYLEG